MVGTSLHLNKTNDDLVNVLDLGHLDDRLCQGDSRSFDDLLDDVLRHAVLQNLWRRRVHALVSCVMLSSGTILDASIKFSLTCGTCSSRSCSVKPRCCARSHAEEAGHESRSPTSRK